VLAYQRVQREWPWVGVVNFWFFKRATDQEKDQSWYYFRMVEPDFTPLPVYGAIETYTHSDEARTLYFGVHQENHWLYPTPAVGRCAPAQQCDRRGRRLLCDRRSAGQPGLCIRRRGSVAAGWAGRGRDLALFYRRRGRTDCLLIPGEQIRLADGLGGSRHTIAIRPGDGLLSIDSLTVGK